MARLGPYEVEAEVGRGNMGRVLRGRHKDTGIVRAIKVLTGVAVDAELIARFQREAELLARVGGEHVVPVHEAGAERGHLYYVMDLLPGGSVRDIIQKRGALPWREAARLVAKVARAIHRCHDVGIVHRDVKPENILIDDRGEPRISDFGCARDLISKQLTVTGTLIGTPSYMPPEQLRGEKVDQRADIYSLGVILYELATGTRPYSGKTWLELCESSEKGSRPSSHETVGAPAELDDILSHTLAPRPDGRYATASELAADLDALAASGDGSFKSPRGSSKLLRRVWIVAAFALLANGFVIAVKVIGRRAPPPPPPASLAVVLESPAEGLVLHDEEAVAVSFRVQGRAWEVSVNGIRVTTGADGAFVGTATFADQDAPAVVVMARGTDERVEVRHKLQRRWSFPAPAWVRRLPKDSRPPLPLPGGLRYSDQEGEYVNAKDGSILVFVPGGPFEMGGRTGHRREQSEQGVKTVQVGPFFIGKYEVTNELFERFVAATHHVTAAEREGWSWDSIVLPDGEDHLETPQGLTWRVPFPDKVPCGPLHPVVHVSWDDCMTYVRWAGLALPLEAQWEKAAAWDPVAKKKRRHAWGDEVPSAGGRPLANLKDRTLLELHGVKTRADHDDGWAHLAPVGSFPADCSFYGAFDMTGNAIEYCADEADFSQEIKLENGRVVKGGGWPTPPDSVHLSSRHVFPSVARGSGTSFRVALDARR